MSNAVKLNELAHKEFFARKAMYAAYEAERADYYSQEENRDYSFPACVHGASNWTDYDNICGPCENGEGYWDDSREWKRAKDIASYALIKFEEKRNKALTALVSLRVEGAPVEVETAVIDWLLSIQP